MNNFLTNIFFFQVLSFKFIFKKTQKTRDEFYTILFNLSRLESIMAAENIILFDYGWNDEIKQKALLPLEVNIWLLVINFNMYSNRDSTSTSSMIYIENGR